MSTKSLENSKGTQSINLGDMLGSAIDDTGPSKGFKIGVMMSMEDHEALVGENARLKEQVACLNKELDALRGTVAQTNILLLSKNSELDLLREQNRRLQEEVSLLSTQLDEARVENKRLREDQEAHQRKSDKQLRRVQNELLYAKYLNAIQDTNAYLRLESVLPSPHKEHLASLHSDRIGSTHYMYNLGKDRDTKEQVDLKLYELQKRLADAPAYIRQTLYRMYGDTVEQVHLELQKLNITDACLTLVSQDDKDMLSEWWLDD